MIRRIVGWVVLVPLCLVMIVFALANRQLVVVNFNPLVPSEALTTPGVGVPMFLVLFAVLLFGVLLGGVATWFAQAPHRRDERAYRRTRYQLPDGFVELLQVLGDWLLFTHGELALHKKYVQFCSRTLWQEYLSRKGAKTQTKQSETRYSLRLRVFASCGRNLHPL